LKITTDYFGAGEGDELIAEIFKEFREGLPERVDTIRDSLETLADGYDAEAAELFYRTAHTLKGTAPSFGADGLVAPSAALADIGKRWYESGELDTKSATIALEEVEQLSIAIQDYIAQMEGKATG
jgi:HPt (histidine-containing phosphotransfer) domain-containing protein